MTRTGDSAIVFTGYVGIAPGPHSGSFTMVVTPFECKCIPFKCEPTKAYSYLIELEGFRGWLSEVIHSFMGYRAV